MPQSETENKLVLIVGYANNKFAVFYNTSHEPKPVCVTSMKQFQTKWWPKIANGILNNSNKLE